MTHCAHPSDIALVVSFHAMVVHFDSSKCDVLVEMAAPKAARATKTNGSAGTPTPRLGRGTNGLVCDGVLVSHVPTLTLVIICRMQTMCSDACFSRDARHAYVSSSDGVVRQVDMDTQKVWPCPQLSLHPPRSSHAPCVVGLARQPWLSS